MMQHQHQSHRSSLQTRVAIAAMTYASPKLAVDAILAYSAVAVEVGSCTEQAVIVEGLHNRNLMIATGPVNRGRNKWKRVVHMNNIGLPVTKQGGEFAMRVGSPNRAADQRKTASG